MTSLGCRHGAATAIAQYAEGFDQHRRPSITRVERSRSKSRPRVPASAFRALPKTLSTDAIPGRLPHTWFPPSRFLSGRHAFSKRQEIAQPHAGVVGIGSPNCGVAVEAMRGVRRTITSTTRPCLGTLDASDVILHAHVAFAHARRDAMPCGVLHSALSRVACETHGASVSSVRWGSSIVRTGLPIATPKSPRGTTRR